ncbi:NAD(+) diphosphatase [[Clostridium] ultunense Esp]|uniref:NAD(+) diphosphatase n=1 Tax=[Clostridium] ultunense Esp TaxID=1288971 RepID=M1Z450_9FIRM|nr:NAD(+) diphosphatase [Schnuerera ultunensis]CCQ92816.1 NAD(+) diphosphatase [[Clostridium] ultunense Esp]SHD75829.1 NAD(+) diphosphatase [[Clostridium] ultunense Esp]
MEDYILFQPSVKPIHKEDEEDFWFLFKDNQLMVYEGKGNITIPRQKDVLDLNISIYNIQCMGAYSGYNCQCGEFVDHIEEENISFMDLRTLSEFVDENIYLMASKANLLLNWLKLNQHCGICGSKMYIKDSKYERAMVCSNCGNTTWPRTSPAIIVAITKEDKLLLARNRQFPNRRYSVIAGFVEYGETFEECVKREVYEEVGIKVKNIKYFGSQPWPYPNSMMIGFTAEYLDGEIKVDGEEIVDADWFTKEEVQGMYKKSISIGSQLIEWFLEKH